MSTPKTTTRTLRVGFKGIVNTTDESVLDWAYTPAAFNFAIKNNALTGEIGVSDAKGFLRTSDEARRQYPALPDGISVKNIFHYRRRTSSYPDDRIVLQCTDGTLYYTSVFVSDTWHKIEGYTLLGDACAVSYNYDGEDVLIMCSSNSNFALLNDSTVTVVATAPRFTALAVHNERVYGAINGEANQLWFSDNFDPTVWSVSSDAAGYITFADECGDVLATITFLGYLYIFREHGIYRLTAYGDQGDFYMKKLFTAGGRIYKDSIALCGDRIMFVTDSGICAFDGYDVVMTLKEAPELSGLSRCVGAYHKGCYTLACTTDIGELSSGFYTNNTVMVYDIAKGDISLLSGINVTRILSLRAHNASDLILLTLVDGEYRLGSLTEDGYAFGTATRKIYRSPYNDLSSPTIKTVREVTLTTHYALELRVIADGNTYSFPLSGSPLPQTVFVGKSGRKIGVELRASAATCYVTQPIVRIDIIS